MTLREWLAAEPFTLTMSSGFFAFFAHAGLASVLEDEGLLPSRVTGSSAGALVGSLWASGRPMPELTDRLFALRKDDFWDPRIGPGLALGLLKGDLFREILRDVAGVERMEDCPIPLQVSAFDGYSRKTHVFSVGPLDQAVYAACAVPFLFRPIWINRRPYWDGGITDRPGLAGIEPCTRIFYHHIKSRSAWRRKNSPSLEIPTRAGMTALEIDGLPKVGPNQLERGPEAFESARLATLKALDCQVADVIRI